MEKKIELTNHHDADHIFFQNVIDLYRAVEKNTNVMKLSTEAYSLRTMQ